MDGVSAIMDDLIMGGIFREALDNVTGNMIGIFTTRVILGEDKKIR